MAQTDLLQQARQYRWRIFWCLAGGYILVFFHRLCTAVVAVDMMNDLNAGGALIGFLSSGYFYPYALMQLPTGLLSDSWGPRRTITLFLAIASVGSVLLGLTPSAAGAMLGRVLVGLGVSTLFVCTLKILAEWFSVREFSLMTAILMAMGGLGSLSAAAPMALLSGWLGWRFAFVSVGALTAMLAVLVWWVVRDRPAALGWPAPAEHRLQPAEIIPLADGVKRVLTRPAFWPLAIWFFFTYGIFISFGGLWGGPYFTQIHGLTRNEASRILSMLAVGMILGGPLLSLVSKRLLKSQPRTMVLSSLLLSVLMAALSRYPSQFPIVGLYGLCLALGIFASAIVVIGFTMTKELFPVQMAGTSIGLVNLFPFAGGAVFQPLLGYILQRHVNTDQTFSLAGYQQAFFVLWLASLAAFGASIFIREAKAAS